MGERLARSSVYIWGVGVKRDLTPLFDVRHFPAYAWPGGYPLHYLTRDGGTLCTTCANANSRLQRDPECPDDHQWEIVGSDILWETTADDPAPTCDHCGAEIESAYGEVERG